MCLSIRNKLLEIQDAWAPEGCTASSLQDLEAVVGDWEVNKRSGWNTGGKKKRPGRKETTTMWADLALVSYCPLQKEKRTLQRPHCRLPLAVITKATFNSVPQFWQINALLLGLFLETWTHGSSGKDGRRVNCIHLGSVSCWTGILVVYVSYVCFKAREIITNCALAIGQKTIIPDLGCPFASWATHGKWLPCSSAKWNF